MSTERWLGVTPDGRRVVRAVWPASPQDERDFALTVTVFERRSLGVERERTFSHSARAVAMDPEGEHLLVACGSSVEDGGGEFSTYLRQVDGGVLRIRLADLEVVAGVARDQPVYAAVMLGEELVLAHARGILRATVGDAASEAVAPRAVESAVASGPSNLAWCLVTVDPLGVWAWAREGHRVRRVKRLGEHGDGCAVAVSPDGRYLATGGRASPSLGGVSASVKVWDATGAGLVTELPMACEVRAVAFDPAGRRLVACGGREHVVRPHEDDRAVCVWDLATGALERTLTGWRGVPRALAVSPEGGLLAVGEGRGVGVYGLEDGARRWRTEGHGDLVMGVAWRGDGARLASAGLDGVVRVWTPEGEALSSVRVKGRAVAVGFDREGAPVAAVHGPVVRPGEGGTTLPSGAVSEDGGLCATLRNHWDGLTVRARNGSALSVVAGHTGEVRCLAGDPSGARFASGGSEGDVIVWSARGEAEWQCAVAPLTDDERRRLVKVNEVTCAAFDQTGGVVVAAAGPRGVVRCWRCGDGTKSGEPREHGAEVTSLGVTDGGETLLSVGGGRARVWVRGAPGVREEHCALAAAMDHHGSVVVEALDGALRWVR